MKEPKAYIYRNLTKKCFSVKFLGKVVEHFTDPVVFGGEFVVNPGGRERVRREGKKYVHAFAATRGSLHPFVESEWEGFERVEVSYNPYKNDSFVVKETGEEVVGRVIVMEYPRVYVMKLGEMFL